MDNEIEHWCPVCDRQIVATYKPVLAPAPTKVAQGHYILSEDLITPVHSQDVTESEATPAVITTPTLQKKRLSTGPAAGRGSRINLHRSKTANGHPYGRRKSGTTENLNLLIQDLIPDLNGGTASKSRTSPDGGSDPIINGQDVGAELNAEAPGGGVNNAELRRPLRRGNSDRALDSHNRNQASEKTTATKRKSVRTVSIAALPCPLSYPDVLSSKIFIHLDWTWTRSAPSTRTCEKHCEIQEWP